MGVVRMGEVNTDPRVDPNHQKYIKLSETIFRLDTTGEYSLSQEFEKDQIPYGGWQGHDIVRRLNYRPELHAAEFYFSSEEAKSLAQRVHHGRTLSWGGDKPVGRLNEDAQVALDKLIERIEDLQANQFGVEKVADWFRYKSAEEMFLETGMDDDELEKLADILTEQALDSDSIMLVGDLAEYLRERLAELEEDEDESD